MKPPTPEEIEQLYVHFQREGNDSRVGGAVTLSDIAEGCGLSEAEVRQALEQLRADRAFTEPPQTETPKKQWPMVLLAASLFVIAGIIYKTTPHPLTEAEVDARLADLQEHRRTHPAKIHYPVTTYIKDGDAASLPGVNIEFRGAYTITKAAPSGDVVFMDKEQLRQRLTKTVKALFERAAKIELEANPPPGTKILNGQAYGYAYQKGSLGLTIRNTVGYIPIPGQPRDPNPAYGQPPQVSLDESIRGMVDMAVTAMESEQQYNLQPVKTASSEYVSPPPGYSVSLLGRHNNGGSSSPLLLLPLDRKLVKIRLLSTMRNILLRDAAPMDFPNADIVAQDAKLKMPAYSEFTIQGPVARRTYKIPTAPSQKYPTAADIARGADVAVERAAEESSQDITRLKPGQSQRSAMVNAQ